MLALAQGFVAVELFKKWRQVSHDALQLHFRTMQKLVAILAVPFKAVQRPLGSRHLHHHSDASRFALRRMARVLGKKKYFSLTDRNLTGRLAGSLHEPNRNISLQ